MSGEGVLLWLFESQKEVECLQSLLLLIYGLSPTPTPTPTPSSQNNTNTDPNTDSNSSPSTSPNTTSSPSKLALKPLHAVEQLLRQDHPTSPGFR